MSRTDRSSLARRRRGAGRSLTGACALAAAAGLLAGCSGTGPADVRGSSAGQESGIGAWPTFLPSPTPQGISTGSLESPAMSYPGSPVLVRIGTTQALVDVEGPSYPAATKVGADEVRCTFTVTISEVTAPVSTRTASFSVLDSHGGLHALAEEPRHALPDRLEPGHGYTLELVGVVPAGEGLLRFYPSRDGAVAAWDYVAETD